MTYFDCYQFSFPTSEFETNDACEQAYFKVCWTEMMSLSQILHIYFSYLPAYLMSLDQVLTTCI